MKSDYPDYIAHDRETGLALVRRPLGEDNPELEYVKFAVRVSLSEISLHWAAEVVGPSFSYTLHVGKFQRFEAYGLAVHAKEQRNPLSPQLNVIVRDDLPKYEWILCNEDGTRRCGSEGI